MSFYKYITFHACFFTFATLCFYLVGILETQNGFIMFAYGWFMMAFIIWIISAKKPIENKEE